MRPTTPHRLSWGSPPACACASNPSRPSPLAAHASCFTVLFLLPACIGCILSQWPALDRRPVLQLCRCRQSKANAAGTGRQSGAAGKIMQVSSSIFGRAGDAGLTLYAGPGCLLGRLLVRHGLCRHTMVGSLPVGRGGLDPRQQKVRRDERDFTRPGKERGKVPMKIESRLGSAVCRSLG